MNMSFNHRHIVKVHHAHMLSPFHAVVVMERLNCNMAEYFAPATTRRFDGKMALKFLREMTSVVVHLGTEYGVAHRDLKPENVMIRQLSGGAFDFVLADFGLSRFESIQFLLLP